MNWTCGRRFSDASIFDPFMSKFKENVASIKNRISRLFEEIYTMNIEIRGKFCSNVNIINIQLKFFDDYNRIYIWSSDEKYKQ